MSILTSASASSVSRGFDYYKNGNILSCERISEDEYEGYVKGNGNEPYHVVVNIKHPRKSECDCPHAQGTNIICKHIVAMYFYLFPEEAQEYEEWRNSDFFDEEYYDDEYDDYDEYEYNSYSFGDDTLPYCYDELLDEYINALSINELRLFMKDRLNEDKNHTYNNFLKAKYNEYVKKHGNSIAKIDELNSKLIRLSRIRDYDFYNFNESILTRKEKQFIENQYNDEKTLFNNTLLNPSLAVFLDYVWVIKFIKDKIDEQTKLDFNNKLNNLFNSLKHYGIRNTMPKSDVLVCLYELNDYSIKDLAVSLVKNIKYIDYVRYVIDRVDDADSLYKNIKERINKERGFISHDIPNVFLEFHERFSDLERQEMILMDHSYYDFLYNNNYQSLVYIYENDDSDYIKLLKQNIHKAEQMMSIYLIEKDFGKLYELIKKENKDYLYDRYLEYIADKYSDELFDHYRKKIFDTLEEGMGRDIYYKAASYFSRVNKLDNGKDRTKQLIEELKKSKHSKKPALFDEINKVTKRLNKTV